MRLSFRRWRSRYCRFNREDRASSEIVAPVITQQYCSSRDYDSNGRLGDEIGGSRGGDATPSLAESIGEFFVHISKGSASERPRMLDMDRGERGLSNGRLDSEFGDIRGDPTSFLAESIGKFLAISRLHNQAACNAEPYINH